MWILWVAALILIAYWIFHSPVCLTMAQSSGRTHGAATPDSEGAVRLEDTIDALVQDVRTLRVEMEELVERVDFAERALTGLGRGESGREKPLNRGAAVAR